MGGSLANRGLCACRALRALVFLPAILAAGCSEGITHSGSPQGWPTVDRLPLMLPEGASDLRYSDDEVEHPCEGCEPFLQYFYGRQEPYPVSTVTVKLAQDWDHNTVDLMYVPGIDMQRSEVYTSKGHAIQHVTLSVLDWKDKTKVLLQCTGTGEAWVKQTERGNYYGRYAPGVPKGEWHKACSRAAQDALVDMLRRLSGRRGELEKIAESYAAWRKQWE